MTGLTRRDTLAALAGAALLPAAHAQGDAWPNRPIKMLVTNAAGGASDLFARTIGAGLSTALGQPVAVENQPAANGMVALANLAKAPADGYTLLVTHGAVVSNEAFHPHKGYQLSQLQPIAMFGTVATAFAVHPSLGVNNIAEFVAKARAMRGAMAYGSFGNGSSAHVLGEIWKHAGNFEMTHVAYKGATPVVTDLIAGHIPCAWAGLQNFLPHMATGKLKVIGLSAGQRHPSFPEVPTFAESGFKEMTLASLAGVLAPAGLPGPVAERITAEVSKIVTAPAFTAKLREIAYHSTLLTGEKFADYIKADVEVWRNAVKSYNIQLG